MNINKVKCRKNSKVQGSVKGTKRRRVDSIVVEWSIDCNECKVDKAKRRCVLIN